MRTLYLAFRNLFRKGQNNVIKIISLAIGLTLGLVLIARISFERSYDTFYPEHEQLYMVYSRYVLNGEPEKFYPQVSGGVVPALAREIPQIEAGTRLDRMGNQVIFDREKNRYVGEVIFADSAFFDVLPRPVLAGDPKQILTSPKLAMISESLAQSIGGTNAVGEQFTFSTFPGEWITIAGIFKDVPENSHLKYDIVLSFQSFNAFFGWDCTDGWMGCDRFRGYVKLKPGTDTESLAPMIREIQRKNQDFEMMSKAGVELSYFFEPMAMAYRNTDEVKKSTLILAIIAFALLCTAALNYILITISSMISRSKSIAIQKCNGATRLNILTGFLAEAFVHVFIALVLSLCLIFLFRAAVEEMASATLRSLFSGQTLLIFAGVLVALFLAAGLIPAYLFSKIPVSHAFRNMKVSRRKWKQPLLLLQFGATAFMFTLLFVIRGQYELVTNYDLGYSHDKLVYCSLWGMSADQRLSAMEELRKNPVVSDVSSCNTMPILGASGNNVYHPETGEELFNLADMEQVDAHFFETMEIPIFEGRAFRNSLSDTAQVMVSRHLADKLSEIMGWEEGVVGKPIRVTGQRYNTQTIIGVFDDIKLGNFQSPDQRPVMISFTPKAGSILMVRLQELTPENIRIVSDQLKTQFPDRDIVVNAYDNVILENYHQSRIFRDVVFIGAIATLLISLIGLIGYVNDETNRRRSEIAVRRVTGASFLEILVLFLRDILFFAVPGVLVGVVFAWWTGEKWMEMFVEKLPFNLLLFIACGIAVLSVILFTVLSNTWKAANENPVNFLKSE